MTRAIELAARDAEVHGAWPDERALERLRVSPSCAGALATAFEIYADRPCLAGERALTFAQVWRRLTSLSGAITRGLGLAPGDRAGLIGFASVDWVVADLACLHAGVVSVPLHGSSADGELLAIVRETELRVLFCSVHDLPALTAILPDCPSVTDVVVMDGPPAAIALAPQVRVHTIAGLEAGGETTAATVGGEDLRTIVYTSGTGGRPKGAMFPERVWLEYWRDPARGGLPPVPGVRLACLPLAHIAGRRQLLYSLVTGGVTHFMRSPDPAALLDEIRRVRPTILMLVPRISALIHQHFLAEQRRRAGADAAIVEEMRHSFLGDRLLLLITGSAPTPPDVARFLPACFDVPVLRGYATTEAGVLTFDERPVANVLSFKLADVPEVGIHASDTTSPRGELLVKTRAMVPGYFRQPEATAALFDPDGYLRTGDIVEQRSPTEIVWIDRVLDVVKLADGTFAELSRLEGIYAAGSPFIRQICLHRSTAGSLVAVVVPEVEAIDRLMPARLADLRRLLVDELQRIVDAAGLRAQELPRDCVVVREPFSVENGCLTTSGKLVRRRIEALLGPQLDALNDAQALNTTLPAGVAIGDAVKALMQPFLSAAWRSQDLPDDVSLGPRGLALDSIALVEALLACETHFGVPVPVRDLKADAAGELTLRGVVDLIGAHYDARRIRSGSTREAR